MPANSQFNHRPLFLAMAIAGALAIYLRGNYLLGSAYAAICAAVMPALVWLLAQSLVVHEGASRLRTVIVLLIASAVSFSMAFPASVNGDMQHLIEQQATDRLAHRELLALFRSDPAFRSLSASAEQLKLVCITVHGSLATRADFDRLRSKIGDDCPTVIKCSLRWDILLRDSGVRVEEIERRKPL